VKLQASSNFFQVQPKLLPILYVKTLRSVKSSLVFVRANMVLNTVGTCPAPSEKGTVLLIYL